MKKWIRKNWLHSICVTIYAIVFAFLMINKHYELTALVTVMYLVGFADGYWKGINK